MWYQGSNESDRLRDALYSARRTILSLLPAEAQTRLESHYDLKTWNDFHGWEREIVEHFVENARVLEESKNSYFGPRACCSLCGSSSSAPYQEGFSLPEGLRRHLTGWGNVQQCDVLEHVFGMVLDARRERFDNSQAEEEAQQKVVLATRREHEMLFDLGPGREIALIDERLDFGLKPRDSALLSWATDRLRSLQFEIVEDGLTRRFIRTVGEYQVYADPRAAARIKLIVYPPALVRRRRANQSPPSQTFEILDSWRNDLPQRFEVRVAEAIEQLSRKPTRRRAAR